MFRAFSVALAVSAASLLCAASLPDSTVPQSCAVQLKANNNDAANLDLIKAAGFKYVRRGFIWAGVEKQEGVYDFSEYDRLVKDCEDRGLSILGCIALNNEKLYGHVKDEKGRLAYARYAAALAEHFKGRKILWEIWNEPNVATFWGKHGKHNTEPYAEEYVNLVKATVPAMKKADPDCFIMAGSVSGLWSASYEWQTFCFGKGVLKTGIDAWSVHPYSFKCPEDYIEAYARVRKMMTDSGADRPLPMLNSERGYPVGHAEGFAGGDERLSREYQAWHFVRQYMIDLLCDIKLTNWYEWSGKEGFSLLDADGADSPALSACKIMMWQLDGYKLDKRIPLASDRDFALRFTNPAGAVKIIAWTAPPAEQSPDMAKPHEVSLPVEAQGAMGLCQIYGDEGTLDARDGAVKITLTPAPQYITVKPDPAVRPKPAIKKPAPVDLTPRSAAVETGPKTDLKMFENGVAWKLDKVGGAGSFALDTEGSRPVGVFSFDFSSGGQYILVTAAASIAEGPTAITFDARAARPQRVTVRIIDETSQVHQFKGGVAGSGEWETIRIPLGKKLEHWGGANDGKIHYPIKALSLSLPAPSGDAKAGKITFADLATVTTSEPAKPAATPKPAADKPAKPAKSAPIAAAPLADAGGKIDLKLFEKGAAWKLGKSGGSGNFALATDGDKPIGQFNFDFTGGGSYVVVTAPTNVPEGVKEITFAARGAIKQRITVRMYDQTRQCHQFKGAIEGTGQWETIRIPLEKRMEHWDGANDGVIHFPLQSISLSLPAPTGDTKAGRIEFADLVAATR